MLNLVGSQDNIYRSLMLSQQGSAIRKIRQYKKMTKVFWSQNGLLPPPSQPLQMHLYISFTHTYIYIYIYIYNIESVFC